LSEALPKNGDVPKSRSNISSPWSHRQAPHITWAKNGEVIIQVAGIGASGKTFIKK
jgi:hypothetical protein